MSSKSKLRDRGIPKDRGWGGMGDGDWWGGGGTHVRRGIGPGVEMGSGLITLEKRSWLWSSLEECVPDSGRAQFLSETSCCRGKRTCRSVK